MNANENSTTTNTVPDPTAIDCARLRADLARLAQESRSLKRRLRARWTEPMADVQRALLTMRQRATERLILLAWTRGGLHVKRRPRSGSVPGTPWVYLPVPEQTWRQRVSWTPEAHRDLVVQALGARYARSEQLGPECFGSAAPAQPRTEVR